MFNKTQQSPLQKVLKLSEIAGKEGYATASDYLRYIESSIQKANQILNNCINSLKKQHICDVELIVNIQEQLMLVQNQFVISYEETKRKLEEKKHQTAKFNITLFGRTMAGKSTLREILTHGDGSTIGHGGQRTTIDVKHYSWNGMQVTDVPGIDAYKGGEDEKKAENEAIYADLVLFLITNGQPESTEADWLCKLKQFDKSIICICNHKKSANDEHRLKRILENPERLKADMNIIELENQFNKFIQQTLPHESVKFIVTHLLAKFYSQQSQYKNVSKQLEDISNFNEVEKAITDIIIKNGVFFRRKCFLSIVDNPLYAQSCALFEMSKDSYDNAKIIDEKIKEFRNWQKNNKEFINNMHIAISGVFSELRDLIPEFVENNQESSNPESEWIKVVEDNEIKDRLNNIIQNEAKKTQLKIQELFNDIEKEISINQKIKFKYDFGNYSITDWKKINGWGSAVTGAISTAIFIITGLTNPIGWVMTGISVLFLLFEWTSESKETKRQKNRQKLTKQINESIDETERISHKSLEKIYISEIEKSLQVRALNHLKAVRDSLFALSDSQRQLALEYNKHHLDISKKMILLILKELKINQLYKNHILKVARIPGKRTLLILSPNIPMNKLPLIKIKISESLGNMEEIDVLRCDLETLNENILFEHLNLPFHPHMIVTKNQQRIHIPNKEYSAIEKDNINLAQQILETQII